MLKMNIKYTKALLFFGLMSCVGAFFNTTVVSGAVPGNLAAPFDIGSYWHICQGYANTVGTHQGTSRLALDLSGGPNCENSASGRPVRAPQNGTVSWYFPSSGSLCITTSAGTSVMMTHIDSTMSGGTSVLTGQQVGTIAIPGQKQNNGAAHLHLQAWSSSNCSNDNNQIPFSTATNSRICGAPDMPTNGPNHYNAGTWGGLSFIATNCSSDSSAVYRFWSPKNLHHFYTASSDEAVGIMRSYPKSIWTYEGISFYVPPTDVACNTSKASVYRFWSSTQSGHFYTISDSERQYIIDSYPSSVWKYEGVAYCADISQEDGTTPVYRFWSNSQGEHFYTIDEGEKNNLINSYPPSVWQYEGIAYYALK